VRVEQCVWGREDRAAHFATSTGFVLVVADGAGGTGYGASAAEAVLARVAASGELADAAACIAALADVDATLRSGETTAVVAAIVGGAIHGASVGDSAAWLIDGDGCRVLSEGQVRKPLLGSGRARPVGFSARLGAGTLLLASDGLVNYAPMRRIVELTRDGEWDGLAARLCELVRLRSGALPDDVAVVLARV
jgi:PPM family protein phosphatase